MQETRGSRARPAGQTSGTDQRPHPGDRLPSFPRKMRGDLGDIEFTTMVPYRKPLQSETIRSSPPNHPKA